VTVSTGQDSIGTSSDTGTGSGQGTFHTDTSDVFAETSTATTTYWLYAQTTLALHAAGSFALGSTTLGSVSYDEQGTLHAGSSYLYSGSVTGAKGITSGQEDASGDSASYFGSGSHSYDGVVSEDYENGGDGLDQGVLLLAYHLHQEGTFGQGSFSLSSVLYTANGTLSSATQGTRDRAGEGTDSHTYSGGGGDGVATGSGGIGGGGLGGGGGGGYQNFGSYTSSGQESNDYSYSQDQEWTASDNGTFSLYQAGSYSQGSYALSSYLYQARGQITSDRDDGGSSGGSGSGTGAGSATGNQLGVRTSGSFAYGYSGSGEWWSQESSTVNYSLREEGTSSGGHGNLQTIIYQEDGVTEYSYHEEGEDHYSDQCSSPVHFDPLWLPQVPLGCP
jgi:hypothetical protein